MKSQTSNLIIVGAVAVTVGTVSFFAGTFFQQQRSPRFLSRADDQRQNMMLNGKQIQGNGMGMRPTSGEIVNIDDTGVTVKLVDGSTKIVLISDQTKINKSTLGSKSDLKVGENVNVFGTQGDEGSVTAQSIVLGETMFKNAK